MKTKVAGFCATFLFIFLMTDVAVAQSLKSRKLFKDAEKAFSESSYSKSIEFCKEALLHNPNYEDAKFLLGRCFYEIKNPGDAETWFLKIVDNEDFSIQSKYWLGLTYKMQGQYETSIRYFDEFLEAYAGRNTQTTKASIEKEGASLAIENCKAVVHDFNFQNAGPRINSSGSEFSVAFGEANNKIVISVLENGSNGENLKFLFAQGWMKVSEDDEFEFLNTPGFEGPGIFDSKGETFYFTQCQSMGQKCRIMVSQKVDGIWLKATPLPQNINLPETSTSDPAISPDGDTLYFASDRRGGMGDTDIWFSVKTQNNSWTNPVNLGQPINTPYRETSPFVSSDGTFYFASDGHPGFGGLDIFYSKGLSGKREIVNAGPPFNSSYDDQHLVVNSETGYLSSDRKEGYGLFDIYTFLNNTKKEIASEAGAASDTYETIYSSIFASRLYEIETKLLKMDFEVYEKLNNSQKSQLQKEVAGKLASMPEEEKEKIKKEDKILYASLSREKRFFVDRLAAAYFDSTPGALQIPDEDLTWLLAMEVSEQRKLYRLMAANVRNIRQELSAQSTSIIPDNSNTSPLSKRNAVSDEFINRNLLKEKPSASLANNDEIDTNTPDSLEKDSIGSNNYTEFTTKTSDETSTPETMDKERPKKHPEETLANEKAFSDLLNTGNSLDFYQSLPFSDRKRVERIMAIKLVNEIYVLNPELIVSDKNYYKKLSASEKEIINRLQHYFRSWDQEQESAYLIESDIHYLSSLPQEKRETIKRIIVRRGIGVDEDEYVKFGTSDWERYKNFSNDEIEKIKKVAQLLKNHQQVFDVALVYASATYKFNDDMALRRSAEDQSPLLASSDPELDIAGTDNPYESVYFNPGEYHLRKEAFATLNELVEIYRQNPGIFINLTAYSAEMNSESENLKLSQLRASAAKKYMENAGIPDYKIKHRTSTLPASSLDVNNIKSLASRKLEISILNSSQIFKSENTTYFIQPGNTLYSLSKASDVSVKELMAMNGLTNYKIYAYQPLRVKKTATLDPELMIEPALHHLYTETTDKDSDRVENENEVKEDRAIDRGEEMMVIQTSEEPERIAVFHFVKKGEKLKSIAKNYGTSEEEIIKLNRLKNKRVKAGDKLLIKR